MIQAQLGDARCNNQLEVEGEYACLCQQAFSQAEITTGMIGKAVEVCQYIQQAADQW